MGIIPISRIEEPTRCSKSDGSADYRPPAAETGGMSVRSRDNP